MSLQSCSICCRAVERLRAHADGEPACGSSSAALAVEASTIASTITGAAVKFSRDADAPATLLLRYDQSQRSCSPIVFRISGRFLCSCSAYRLIDDTGAAAGLTQLLPHATAARTFRTKIVPGSRGADRRLVGGLHLRSADRCAVAMLIFFLVVRHFASLLQLVTSLQANDLAATLRVFRKTRVGNCPPRNTPRT